MKLHFHAGAIGRAEEACAELIRRYGQSDVSACDTIVVLGGDGTMLESLHRFKDTDKPVYGMNFGSVGFLMNPYNAESFEDRLAHADAATIRPLVMEAVDANGDRHTAIAYNEVSLLRTTRQTARLRVLVNGIVRIPELVCDGILLATPAGSTAYNLSGHGPILPLSANLLALTPISAFRPRRWRGALVPSDLAVRIDSLDDEKRPVSVTADSLEFRDIVSVDIHQSTRIARTLLFDPDHHLEERIFKEQFVA